MPANSIGRLDDGFSTLVTFAGKPNIKLWTKTTKPIGLSGGGPIETKDMHRTRFRTKKPKKLLDITPGEIKCAYATEVINDIVDHLQTLDEITITFEDGTTWMFWGWMDEFMPDDCEEGAQPTATVKFEASAEDDQGVEVGVTYGTGG